MKKLDIRYKWMQPLVLLAVALMAFVPAMAAPREPSTMSNPLAQALVVIMIMLAVAIAILGNVVVSAITYRRDKLKAEREAAQAASAGKLTAVVAALLLSLPGLAQDAEVAVSTGPRFINGLSPFTFYLMVSVIAVEILILIALIYQLRFLMGIPRREAALSAEAAAAKKPAFSWQQWWWRINAAVSREREKEIDLSHDYDGIRELDNKVPPWWTFAFALSILFGAIYMWRYHVSHSAPLMIEEYELAVKAAEKKQAEYLRNAANNVDENTVTLLDAAGIAAGKAVFDQNCVACHGSQGEGNAVGPNLTDEYWLHGGSLSDIFKSVKYGWPEKGMQSWKEMLSPVKIAQVSSYIHSLQGTNPPNAREPQGEKYVPEAAESNGEGEAAEPAKTDAAG